MYFYLWIPPNNLIKVRGRTCPYLDHFCSMICVWREQKAITGHKIKANAILTTCNAMRGDSKFSVNWKNPRGTDADIEGSFQ